MTTKNEGTAATVPSPEAYNHLNSSSFQGTGQTNTASLDAAIRVSNHEFLQTVFGADAQWTHVTSFLDSPTDISADRRGICWAGGFYQNTYLQPNSNQYYCISTFYADKQTGRAVRRKADYRATHVIVADDVREKLDVTAVERLPKPTFKLETSPGSEQWGWVLDSPCTERSQVENLLDGLVKRGLAPDGKDPGMCGVTRYVRLPEGINTKASRVRENGGVPPRCKLLEWNPAVRISIEVMAQPFGINLDEERRDARTDGAAELPDHPLLNTTVLTIKAGKNGIYDATCPWVEGHTGQADDGAAVFTNADGSIGFKCHHGSCADRTAVDLLDYLEDEAPGFKQQLKAWQTRRQLETIGASSVDLDFMNAEPFEIEVPTLVTDLRVAKVMAHAYMNILRWLLNLKKWIKYDGRRWSTDVPGAAFAELSSILAPMYDHARQIEDDESRQRTLRSIVQLEAHRRQESVLAAASVLPEMAVSSHQLDQDPMLLNVLNGTIDLRTGKLRPHRADDFITRLVNLEYDNQAKCPDFEIFLQQIMGGKQDLVDYLQRFIGYCLTGKTTEQVLLFMYGTGANGKSTLATIIEHLLCDLASVADSSILMQRDNRNATNDLAALRGARLVKVSEFNDGERLAEATIKTLTGGDRITCRFLYGEFFEYIPQFKILLLGNYKPQVRGQDHGIWRRIHLLPFTVTFSESERDPSLTEKLMAELPGILTWAVRGCLEWQRIGLSPPAEVLNEVNSYRKREDIFGQWLEEQCILGADQVTEASRLLTSFANFSGWRKITSTRLGKMLADKGFSKEKSNTIRWRGIGLMGHPGQLNPFFVKSPKEQAIGTFTENEINNPDCPTFM